MRTNSLAVSWEVFDSIDVKGSWSQETKDFSHTVAGTVLDFDSAQTVAASGVGYHAEIGEATSDDFEARAIIDFDVDHSIPLRADMPGRAFACGINESGIDVTSIQSCEPGNIRTC